MTKETIEAMLLRIVEKENGEILVLYNDGRYGKASISTLREIFEGLKPSRIWWRNRRMGIGLHRDGGLSGENKSLSQPKRIWSSERYSSWLFYSLPQNTGNGDRSEPLRSPFFYALSLSTRISFMLTPHSLETA